MNYLIDTNVISELRKQARCHHKVKQWFHEISSEQLFTSVLVIGELRKGIEIIRQRDTTAAFYLTIWLERIATEFNERILTVDHQIAEEWG